MPRAKACAKAARASIMRAIAVFLLVVVGAAAQAADQEPLGLRPQLERLAADLATELSRLCPAATAGDQAAFDRCRLGLYQDSLLKRNLSAVVLWGRRHNDAAASLKETNLTQFAPDVLAGLYLPLFMFNGRHTLEYDARES